MGIPTAAEPQTARLRAAELPQFAEGAATVAGAIVGSPDAYVVEPKVDGWRVLVEVREDGVRVYSRSGKSYTGQLPHIEAEVAERFPPGTWLDGEAAALSVTDGLVDVRWGIVQSVMTTTRRLHHAHQQVTLMVFDLIAHGGVDARPLPLHRRRALLESVFAGDPFRHVALLPQYPADAFGAPDDAHAAFLAQGFEGTVVKRRDARYASGSRGAGWSKVKPELTLDAVVMGGVEGEGGFRGMLGALVFGQWREGVLVERGRCSGMTLAQRLDMTARLSELVEAGAVVEVAYTEIMPSGELRFPRFRRLRPDRAGEAVAVHD